MRTELKYFQVPQSLSSASLTQGGAKGLDLVTLPEDKSKGIDEPNCEFSVPEKRSKNPFSPTDLSKSSGSPPRRCLIVASQKQMWHWLCYDMYKKKVNELLIFPSNFLRW